MKRKEKMASVANKLQNYTIVLLIATGAPDKGSHGWYTCASVFVCLENAAQCIRVKFACAGGVLDNLLPFKYYSLLSDHSVLFLQVVSYNTYKYNTYFLHKSIGHKN